MWLNFLYTVQLVISDVCAKFQNSRSSSSGEIFDENFHIHYLGVRDGKRKQAAQRATITHLRASIFNSSQVSKRFFQLVKGS